MEDIKSGGKMSRYGYSRPSKKGVSEHGIGQTLETLGVVREAMWGAKRKKTDRGANKAVAVSITLMRHRATRGATQKQSQG